MLCGSLSLMFVSLPKAISLRCEPQSSFHNTILAYSVILATPSSSLLRHPRYSVILATPSSLLGKDLMAW